MASIADLADDYWELLKHHEPYYAVLAGEPPGSIEPVNEITVGAQSADARQLLGRLDEAICRPRRSPTAAVTWRSGRRVSSHQNSTSATFTKP